MGDMVFGMLVCSDEGCGAVYEIWCEDCELESVSCEVCGCALQVISSSECAPDGPIPAALELQLRDAA
jgi:hypothetical protein